MRKEVGEEWQKERNGKTVIQCSMSSSLARKRQLEGMRRERETNEYEEGDVDDADDDDDDDDADDDDADYSDDGGGC
eukprot:7557599-Pyramimonas_sp.AAC.1